MVYIERKCPNCGKIEISDFQTKCLDSLMNTYNIGDQVPSKDTSISFLDICGKCGCSIYAFGHIDNGKLIDIEIYEYKVPLEKHIKIRKSYYWNHDIKKFALQENNKLGEEE